MAVVTMQAVLSHVLPVIRVGRTHTNIKHSQVNKHRGWWVYGLGGNNNSLPKLGENKD